MGYKTTMGYKNNTFSLLFSSVLLLNSHALYFANAHFVITSFSLRNVFQMRKGTKSSFAYLLRSFGQQSTNFTRLLRASPLFQWHLRQSFRMFFCPHEQLEADQMMKKLFICGKIWPVIVAAHYLRPKNPFCALNWTDETIPAIAIL
jgi:hypothetical protein